MNEHDKDNQRSSADLLLSELRAAGCDVKAANKIRCVWHDDQHPSAGIFQGDDGAWRFKCQACGVHGDVFDIRAKRTGKALAEVLIGDEPVKQVKRYESIDSIKQVIRNIEQVYEYRNPDTKRVDMLVIRQKTTKGKTFLQGHQSADSFVLQAPAKPWPLYNRTQVRDAAEVVIVEGEKCVHALRKANIVGTTSPGGSKNAANADWSPLAGKTVYLMRDNDEAGLQYERDVIKLLEGVFPRPNIRRVPISLMELDEKGDVADYLTNIGGTPEDQNNAITLLMGEAESLSGSKGLETRINDMILGKWKAIPWPWPEVSRLTKALLPGTVTVLCGNPGSTKSFYLLEAAIFWHQHGHPMCIFELEEDKTYYLHRWLAMVARDSKLVDDEWIAANPDAARTAYDANKPQLDALAECLFDTGDQQITLDYLAEWVEQQASNGKRVIGIDPITMAATSDMPWRDDHRFLVRTKASMVKYGASLILVTHPRSSAPTAGSGMDNMAGGRAYQRFTQTVMYIKSHLPKDYTITKYAPGFGDRDELANANRIIHIGKARNGRGGGMEIAYTFDGGTFAFAEHGLIKSEKE